MSQQNPLDTEKKKYQGEEHPMRHEFRSRSRDRDREPSRRPFSDTPREIFKDTSLEPPHKIWKSSSEEHDYQTMRERERTRWHAAPLLDLKALTRDHRRFENLTHQRL
jgi:hypothetical protein